MHQSALVVAIKMAEPACVRSLRGEIMNEMAVLNYNTSLIIAEMRRLNEHIKTNTTNQGKKRRRHAICSEDESDSDSETARSFSIEDSSGDDDDDELARAAPRRSRRITQRRSALSPTADAPDSGQGIEYSKVYGEVRLHKDDGPYITGTVTFASTPTGKSPTARIRWLKPFADREGGGIYVYCDWPAQIVDLVHPSSLSAVPVLSQSRQMYWDHIKYNGAQKGFLSAAFEVLPYYYEYSSGTTTDFTPVFQFMLESGVHRQSGLQARTDYKMKVLSLVSDCYHATPHELYKFGTRTEADMESNVELARMACETRRKDLRVNIKETPSGCCAVCDCCNKRSAIACSLMHLRMCGACRCRFEKLVDFSDAITVPPKKTPQIKNTVLVHFSSLMYAVCDMIG
tara:strand:- start:158 stop:1357 length:1200 start_codon:yes stop_codon:yes gene_type:complete